MQSFLSRLWHQTTKAPNSILPKVHRQQLQQRVSTSPHAVLLPRRTWFSNILSSAAGMRLGSWQLIIKLAYVLKTPVPAAREAGRQRILVKYAGSYKALPENTGPEVCEGACRTTQNLQRLPSDKRLPPLASDPFSIRLGRSAIASRTVTASGRESCI